MLELSQGVLTSYSGSYRDFLRQKASREALAEAGEQRRLDFLRREIDWIRRAPKARGTKSQSRVKRFEDAANQGPLQRERDIELVIPPAPPLAKRVLTLEKVGMTRGNRTLFENLSLDLQAGDRIGVVGPNGAGKTTLLRIMLGELTPTSGRVLAGPRTQFNYADQNRCILDPDKTVFEEIGEGKDFVSLGDRTLNLWAYLKRFLFTDDEIHTPVGQLSGGERSRLVLAKILTRGGNVILLDEPTNDLDLSTLRILEEGLADFDGCVLVVSHDRTFLNRVCNAILAFEPDGSVCYQPGDYDYYVEKRDRRRREQTRDQDDKPQPAETRRAKPPGKLTWKQEREIETIEEQIPDAEDYVRELESLFSSPTFFEDHGTEVKELTERLDRAKQTVESLYARWGELEELRESVRPD
jgi:ATP-binding cassette subfamily F protein uup